MSTPLYEPLTFSLTGDDYDLMVRVVNQGIDSRLEAVTDSNFVATDRSGIVAALDGVIETEDDLKVICRRLCELSNSLYDDWIAEGNEYGSGDGSELHAAAERLASDLWAYGMYRTDEDRCRSMESDEVWDLLKD